MGGVYGLGFSGFRAYIGLSLQNQGLFPDDDDDDDECVRPTDSFIGQSRARHSEGLGFRVNSESWGVGLGFRLLVGSRG